MSAKVLVIGATGMLGKPVAERLLSAGISVRVLARNPDKAVRLLGTDFEIVSGDVEKPETLPAALEGCKGVHINLSGGTDLSLCEKVEHRGTAAVAEAASRTGIERLTYISGISVAAQSEFLPARAKFSAEEAIRKSGLSYTIFRPSWFMESLPLFVRGKRIVLIGQQPHPWRWIAADDYAEMVLNAHLQGDYPNITAYTVGPEALTFRQAVRTYVEIVQPKLKVQQIPLSLAKFFAAVTFKSELRGAVKMMEYFEEQPEVIPASMDSGFALLEGKTTLEQWCRKRVKDDSTIEK
jgi:uncharacterized protein YbjT (DUF2867 family)